MIYWLIIIFQLKLRFYTLLGWNLKIHLKSLRIQFLKNIDIRQFWRKGMKALSKYLQSVKRLLNFWSHSKNLSTYCTQKKLINGFSLCSLSPCFVIRIYYKNWQNQELSIQAIFFRTYPQKISHKSVLGSTFR